MIQVMILAVALAAGNGASPTSHAVRTDTPADTVASYIAAQRDFDQAALAALTAPEFVEISPVGEVDPRTAVIGFYAADKRVEGPPLTATEQAVRTFDDTAIVTLRLAFGPGAIRATYVARRTNRNWKLVSAQYTPIRGGKPG